MLFIIMGIAVLALIIALILGILIIKKSQGSPKMKEISKAIQDGAMTFLYKEYKVLREHKV